MRVYIKTFGCQMNEKDSERMLSILNCEKAESPQTAEVIIINTCAVREKPENKVFSELGIYKNLKMQKTGIKIGITGCVAQIYGENLIKKIPYLDFVAGTQVVNKIPEILERVKKGERFSDTSFNYDENDRFLSPVGEREANTVKSYVTIQEGCDQFCSFCIVPLTRGREIARPPPDILIEIKKLVENGVKEVTLLGQNVNGYRYGRNSGRSTFPQLLKEINNIEGLERIRFTTSNPKYVDEELVKAFTELEKLCEHIHLPVQSGSDSVLKSMRRKYTRSFYFEAVEKLRNNVPNIAITTDIIVGFPGESEKDFNDTITLMKGVQFDDIYSFKFSARKGTSAEVMKDQIPEHIKDERLKEVQKLQDEISLKKMTSYIGKKIEVLVEGKSKKNKAELTGRTRCYKIVNFKGEAPDIIGKLIDVNIISASRNSLRGQT